MSLVVEEFFRKSFPVQAVRVTAANMTEVAEWCGGIIRTEEEGTFIKVRVENPLTEKQTKAFAGDWVLYAGKGYKVYTDKAFRKSFVEHIDKPSVDAPRVEQNVFEEKASVGSSPQSHEPSSSGVGNPGGTRNV